ncbi:hypothetical protein IAE19_09125 [Acinetobacter sp. S40]|uniref:hypothetical protein n=1 Tax=Acinetobacter sp. S40 TaxID=2767434 RepID=UPI00190C59C2|nr:hypothetical protein [Acinetobacter sp. S40]MBJ9985602.1 hypothetical protein [Acinetobacter sp. S40]
MTITQTLKLRELAIVDENDQTRIQLTVKSNVPSIEFLNERGEVSIQIILGEEGYPSIQLLPISDQLLNVKLEMDSKGAHLKFDHEQGSSCYVFLNNVGTSGMVMLDAKKQRRFTASVTAQGDLHLEP